MGALSFSACLAWLQSCHPKELRAHHACALPTRRRPETDVYESPLYVRRRIALQGLRRHLFRRDVLDQRRLNRFKLGVVRYSEGILDGVRAPVGVVGHALRDAIEELKSGNDLGDLNLAINVSSEDRIGFWVGRDSFDPI